MSCFLQSWGSQTIVSMGSTSLAMMTSLAFLSSMRPVTLFKPYLRAMGALVSAGALSRKGLVVIFLGTSYFQP